ncbi:MAG: ABC transporter substrate-binding protein, partial [Rhizobiales bacterium]|nr:ABC transporter substrate-binding protein [Hyphomicrobiales bacterium]
MTHDSTFNRRQVFGLGLGAAGLATGFGPRAAIAQAATISTPDAAAFGAAKHGMSVFGDLKYPADFTNFDYVNLKAPKSGAFSTVPSVRAYNQSYQTFNSLNAYILKGEGAQGMDLTFAPLMVRAFDEPDAMYGLVAQSVAISD